MAPGLKAASWHSLLAWSIDRPQVAEEPSREKAALLMPDLESPPLLGRQYRKLGGCTLVCLFPDKHSHWASCFC